MSHPRPPVSVPPDPVREPNQASTSQKIHHGPRVSKYALKVTERQKKLRPPHPFVFTREPAANAPHRFFAVFRRAGDHLTVLAFESFGAVEDPAELVFLPFCTPEEASDLPESIGIINQRFGIIMSAPIVLTTEIDGDDVFVSYVAVGYSGNVSLARTYSENSNGSEQTFRPVIIPLKPGFAKRFGPRGKKILKQALQKLVENPALHDVLRPIAWAFLRVKLPKRGT